MAASPTLESVPEEQSKMVRLPTGATVPKNARAATMESVLERIRAPGRELVAVSRKTRASWLE